MELSFDVFVDGEPDDLFNKMKVVYDACMVADVEIPDEVVVYFENMNPNNLRKVARVPFKIEYGEMVDYIVVKTEDIPAGSEVVRIGIYYD